MVSVQSFLGGRGGAFFAFKQKQLPCLHVLCSSVIPQDHFIAILSNIRTFLKSKSVRKVCNDGKNKLSHKILN